MKKQFTEEEKAAFKARRQATRAELSAMSQQIKMLPEWAEEANLLIITKANGEELSPLNKMLVALQRNNASQVAGFAQWHKSGRHIRKGEKGIHVWVKGERLVNADRGSIPPGETPNDEPQTSSPETNMYFVVGTVFDISQTQEMSREANS